ncbi:MAG TPA: L-fucose/L-arabinose isomerase family protein [Phycisphaerae bacterium]|nr:L-fucose/L-arabinose isomerase family protein [Phycisphaerae bacterium]
MKIERRKPLTARVGVFGVGHATYWAQFPGLKEELLGYLDAFEKRLAANQCEVVPFGLVDDAASAYAAAGRMKAAGLDLVFCDMLTYATSSTWGVVCRELDVPIVLVALQPLKAMDYSRGSTRMQLANDSICSLPEFAGVAVRMGREVPPMIIGTLDDDPAAWAEVAEWCRIAHVLHDLRGARIGQMGHVLEAMLDMHTDPTALTAHFGLHVVQVEPDAVVARFQEVTDAEADAMARRILDFFDAPDPQSDPITRKLTAEDLATAARVAVALERFVDAERLDGLAYYYEGEEGSEVRRVVTNLIVGNSMLTAAGFPMCGELDLKTCVAMLLMDRLEIGGSFAEFHPVDFDEGFILVGHDGPHHLNVADGKPVLRSLTAYHGKPGRGASVEFQLKAGPITMLSIGQTFDGRFKFVIAEGESRRGPIPPTGNTNTRGFFAPDPVTFLKRWLAEGPTHHFALGIGHHAATIAKIADCLGIEWAVASPGRAQHAPRPGAGEGHSA